MTYKFRQTTYSTRKGLFWLDAPFVKIELKEGSELSLVARDADTLAEATRFHFECGGYPSEEDALSAGQRFREIIHILTAALSLEQIVEVEDKQVGFVADSVKNSVEEKGSVLLDQRSGLSVIPDDGLHGEFVSTGAKIVKANSPDYVLVAIEQLWNLDIQLDAGGQAVLEMLSLSTSEVSPATKFLTTYLALEQLIERKARSAGAVHVLTTLGQTVIDSDLEEKEKESLCGVLRSLTEESFSSAFKRYMLGVRSPEKIEGILTADLAPRCIRFRNKIAHSPSKVDPNEARLLTKALRATIFGILWSRFDLPHFSIDRPADRINIEQMEMRVL